MIVVEYSKELTRKLEKLQKKDKTIFEAIIRRIKEIRGQPEHYKPLSHDLKGYRRVHVMKSFVLIFRIDYNQNKLIFIDFDHHDKIYK